MGEWLGKTQNPAIAGIGDVEITGRVDGQPDGGGEAGGAGLVAVAGGVIRNPVAEIRLADDNIGFLSGLQVAQVVEAEDAVIKRIGDVKMRGSRVEVDGESGFSTTACPQGEIELAAFDEIRSVEIQRVLPQDLGSGREGAVRVREN